MSHGSDIQTTTGRASARSEGTMDWKSELSEQGVTERGFPLPVGEETMPGTVWTPAERPVRATVLIGHGGTQHKRTPGVLSLARRLARHLDYASVAIDAPSHGDRRDAPEERVTPDEMRRRAAAMNPEQMGAVTQR